MQPLKTLKPFCLASSLKKERSNVIDLFAKKKKKKTLLFSANVVIGQSSCKCPGLSVRTVSPFTILYTVNTISYQF